MNTRWLPVLASVAVLITACVTVNVYFPAAAAEDAADEIIDGVWGSDSPPDDADGAPPQHNPPEPTSQRRPPGRPGMPAAALAALGDLLLPAAHARDADIDLSSPAIRRIESSMRARHAQLRPYYEAGAIGLNRDGLVEIRDPGAVPLAERNQLRRLIAEENADRNNLYREIAVANDHPEWEPRVREIFARRWIERARSGWYYRDPNGEWRRK